MKILFVDDEPKILRGITRTIESEFDDWDVEIATSGAEALEILREDDFNVLVSDLKMPGMDGGELLALAAKRHPSLLRVILTGQADRETVMQAIAPMHQFLHKPCDANQLMEVIQRAEVFQNTITSTKVLNAIGQSDCLPSLPSLVLELNEELNSEKFTLENFTRIVEQNPTLSAKILQLANSALFGLQTAVVGVERGIAILGAEMVRVLALSIAVFETKCTTTAQYAKQLFEHCFEVATIGRKIATWENMDCKTINEVFTGSLLHDVGKVVLLNAFTDKYNELRLQAAASETTMLALEMEEFGATHAGIGAYLLEAWGLPNVLINAVGSHHNPEICSRSSETCRIIYAANLISHGLENLDAEDEKKVFDPFDIKVSEWNQRFQTEREHSNDECSNPIC